MNTFYVSGCNNLVKIHKEKAIKGYASDRFLYIHERYIFKTELTTCDNQLSG